MNYSPYSPAKCFDFIHDSLAPGERDLRMLLAEGLKLGFSRPQIIWSLAQLLARGEIEMESFGHQDFISLKKEVDQCRRNHA